MISKEELAAIKAQAEMDHRPDESPAADILCLVAEVDRLTGLVNSTIPGLLAENENLLGFIKHLIAVHQRPAGGCGMCAAIAAKLAEEESANKEGRE